MTITTFTSRKFNQDVSAAKKAARSGPVFITDRGRPAHVLMTIESYESLAGARGNIVEMLAMPGAESIDFEPGRVGSLSRLVNLD